MLGPTVDRGAETLEPAWRPEPGTGRRRRDGRRTHIRSAAGLTMLVLSAGCAHLQERTVILEPVRSTRVVQSSWENFGVCHIRLESRASALVLNGMFYREPSFYGVNGYEVLIARGESCHLRTVAQYQAAIEFDLTALPAGALVRAELTSRSRDDYGVDPPIRIGSWAQCSVLTLGRATAAWEEGAIPSVAVGSEVPPWRVPLRDLIPWDDLRPPVGRGLGLSGTVDVTRTVGAWMRGEAPNFGFVFTPDHAEVRRIAATVGDTHQQLMCGSQPGDARLAVTILTGS
jgi:hypothetical protein